MPQHFAQNKQNNLLELATPLMIPMFQLVIEHGRIKSRDNMYQAPTGAGISGNLLDWAQIQKIRRRFYVSGYGVQGQNPNSPSVLEGSKNDDQKKRKKRKKRKQEKKRQEKRNRKLEKKNAKKKLKIAILRQEIKHQNSIKELQQEAYCAQAQADAYATVLDKLLSHGQYRAALPEYTIEADCEVLDD